MAGGVYALIPIGPRKLEPTGLGGTALRVFAYVAVYDFLYYWYHRAQDLVPALWQLHEFHHADEELNVTTSYRTYWLEYPVQVIALGWPTFMIVGIDPAALPWFFAISTVLLIWTHANIRLSLGRATPFVIGPQYHRVHHSRLMVHRDQNFAQALPLWDVVFGTYFHPARDEFPPTGADDQAGDAPVSAVLATPFVTWWRMVRGPR